MVNIPKQLQTYKTHIAHIGNIQVGLFSSKALSDRSGIEHSKIIRSIEKLINNGHIHSISHATNGASNNIAVYRNSHYFSRGKAFHEYELNHTALSLFIQSMNGTKGLTTRKAFDDFTRHAYDVTAQIDFEATPIYIETRNETIELAKEFNEAVFNIQSLATSQGSNSSVDKFEMSYNALIKRLIIGKGIKGSWRDHTDEIELPLLHTMLRTGIATINHHLHFEDHYKEIYKSVKMAMIEAIENCNE